ncbi:MAG: ArsR/SmtB family transcription factor [Nocardioidaceae bacterium]
MHRTWEALADDTRRSIVEVLADGERTAGELAAMFSISRPGVSRHLRVLRDAGLVRAAPQAQRRIYRLDPQGLAQIDGWLDQFRRFWSQRLDALETEVARGKHTPDTSTSDSPKEQTS